MTKRVVILGGGASGYTAAVAAGSAGAEVILIERGGKPLRKVLASGNGRCNLSNQVVDVSCYCTQNPDTLAGFLSQSALVTEFWQDLGVLTRADEAGRLYPWSNQARSVADSLVLRAASLGVRTVSAEVISLSRGDSWRVHTSVGDYFGDAVVVALGSSASPSLGATDAGLRLAAALDVPFAPFVPSLVSLRTRPRYASLKGCRQFCRLTLRDRVEDGEVLFTDYGLSGVAVMQLSAFASAGDEVSIDLLPRLSLSEIRSLLFARLRSGVYPTAETFLVGLLDKPLSYALLKEAGLSPLDLPVSSVTPAMVERLSSVLKGWRFTVVESTGFDNAQVARGGVLLSALDESLQSISHRGLYFTGEVVDVTGLCGGYNLHWAWLSGLIAGCHAAR